MLYRRNFRSTGAVFAPEVHLFSPWLQCLLSKNIIGSMVAVFAVQEHYWLYGCSVCCPRTSLALQVQCLLFKCSVSLHVQCLLCRCSVCSTGAVSALQCKVYCVVECAVHSEQYSLQCIMHSAQCTVALHSVQCTVHCRVCSAPVTPPPQ